MKNSKLKGMHKYFGISAMLMISSFLLSSILAEISQDSTMIFQVKKYIVFAVPILLILLPATALSGKNLASKRQHPLIKDKIKRMKFIAFNGIFLVFLAIILFVKASNDNYDISFWLLQILEFLFGITNIILLALMARDGMKLSRRL